MNNIHQPLQALQEAQFAKTVIFGRLYNTSLNPKSDTLYTG